MYVKIPSVLPFLFFFAALQDVKRERPKSRFGAVYSLNPENPSPTPYRHGADPKDTAHRSLLARQRLHERASCSCEKPLLSARGALQDMYGKN